MKKWLFLFTLAFSLFAYAGNVTNPILEDETQFEKILDLDITQDLGQLENESFLKEPWQSRRGSTFGFLENLQKTKNLQLANLKVNPKIYRPFIRCHIDPGRNL